MDNETNERNRKKWQIAAMFPRSKDKLSELTLEEIKQIFPQVTLEDKDILLRVLLNNANTFEEYKFVFIQSDTAFLFKPEITKKAFKELKKKAKTFSELLFVCSNLNNLSKKERREKKKIIEKLKEMESGLYFKELMEQMLIFYNKDHNDLATICIEKIEEANTIFNDLLDFLLSERVQRSKDLEKLIKERIKSEFLEKSQNHCISVLERKEQRKEELKDVKEMALKCIKEIIRETS